MRLTTRRGEMVALRLENCTLWCKGCQNMVWGFDVLRLNDGWEFFCPNDACSALLLKVEKDDVRQESI